jgi:hypothetical protein
VRARRSPDGGAAGRADGADGARACWTARMTTATATSPHHRQLSTCGRGARPVCGVTGFAVSREQMQTVLCCRIQQPSNIRHCIESNRRRPASLPLSCWPANRSPRSAEPSASKFPRCSGGQSESGLRLHGTKLTQSCCSSRKRQAELGADRAAETASRAVETVWQCVKAAV